MPGLDEQLARSYRASDDTQILMARHDVCAFIRYVMRDDRTGRPIVLADMHREWHWLADQYDRLIIWAFMESGKTSGLSVARTLFRLGRDPGLRFVIVSATSMMSTKIAQQIARYIESSEALHQVFPEMKPDRRNPWNTEQLTIKRPYLSRDPSITVASVGTNVQGSRFDEAILDDALNRENTHSAYVRAETQDWFLKSIPGRMHPSTGRIVMVQNALHPEDLAHTLVKSPRWHGFKYPIQMPDGSPRWPERWPLEAIERRKQELILPSEIASQLYCEARDDSDARFKRAWIDLCLKRGHGKRMADHYALRGVPAGCRVYCGVDLAIGRGKDNDLTAFFVLLIHPTGDREVLWIESGRWLAAEIIAKVLDFYARFQCVFVIENNAAQGYLVQLLQGGTAIPIVPFTTGSNKADPSFGLEALGAQLAAGKWIVPNIGGSCEPEVEAWIGELLSYRPPPAHTGDRAMAAWFASEGERLGAGKAAPKVGSIRLDLAHWG